MHIESQSIKIWGECPPNKNEALKLIEKAGRTCYNSIDKITEDSAPKFVGKLLESGHLSVLEHSNIVLRHKELSKNPYSLLDSVRRVYNSKYLSSGIYNGRVYVGGNYRAWLEWYNQVNGSFPDCHITEFPMCLESEAFELVVNTKDIPYDFKRITVEMFTSRDVLAEVTRHREASFSVQSQRYVRYNDPCIIAPVDIERETDIWLSWKSSILYSIEMYKKMVDLGAKPQQARDVLPNSMSTVIVMTADMRCWNNFFKLRCSSAADPQMRDIADKIKDQLLIHTAEI